MSLLEFDEVNKYFGDTHVLKDVDLNVEEGEVCVVIGPSGSGKSTLLRCANRLEEIQGGEIRLEGQSISAADADINRLRQRIGMVFQSFNLFPHKTARENVTLAPTKVKGLKKGDAERRADELLDRVGLGAQSNSYPNQLSGGQQQRVAIARALVSDPAVLIADEPTGELDTETGQRVLDYIEQTATERAVVVATHDEHVIERADRVVRLRDGRVVSDG